MNDVNHSKPNPIPGCPWMFVARPYGLDGQWRLYVRDQDPVTGKPERGQLRPHQYTGPAFSSKAVAVVYGMGVHDKGYACGCARSEAAS